MASRYQNFIKGIGLVPNATDANSKKGDLNVTSADGKLNYHNGTSSSPAVTEAHTAELTNKTIGDSLPFKGSTSGTTTIIANAVASGTLTLPATTDTLVGKETSDTLKNKTISGNDNTLSNIGNSSLTNSSITVNGANIALGGSATITAATNHPLTISTGLLGTSFDGSTPVTISIDSTVVTLTGSQVLTNKTLTSPVINTATADTISGIAGGALTLQSASNQNVNIQALGTGNVQIEDYTFSANTLSTVPGSGMIISPSTGNIELISGPPMTTGGAILFRTRAAFDTDVLSTTGTAVTVSTNKSQVSFTNSGLVSVAGFISNKTGEVIYINNNTGNPITILNDSASATSDNRIYTGTGDDLILENNATIAIIYVGYSTTKWMVVGGTGAGAVLKVVAGESITAGQAVYISTGTGSDSGRTAGRAYKLDAANDDRVDFVGVAKSSVSSGSNLQVITIGEASGLTGLTTGKTIFADPTSPGDFVNTAPLAVNQWIIPVGVALSANKMAINGAGSATAVKITSTVVDGLYADVQTYSANTTLTNANSVVLVNASAGSRTITLPAPARGKIFNIKKIDSSLNAVVISPPSGTIDGSATKSLAFQYDSLMITSDGTNFFLI